MRGLIVYGREGYEDGGEFVEQTDAYVAAHNDVKLAIAEDIAIAVSGREVIVCLPDGTGVSREEGLPEWVMMRSTDWKCALAFEMMGVPCFPPSGYIMAASDKAVSHIAMTPALSSPNTLVRRGGSEVSEIPTPYIVKAAQGFGGKTVKRIENLEDGESFTRELEQAGEEPIYQRPAPTPDDLRVYIMGKNILFAILRKAQDGNDKANFCQGARGIPYELRECERSAIERAIGLFADDLGFVSMDFLIGEDGELMFNEMNCFPGLAGLVQMGWQEGFVDNYVSHIEGALSHGE